MALPLKLVGMATTGIAAVGTAVYLTVATHNVSESGSSNTSAASQQQSTMPDAGPDDITVCVGGDRILRVPPNFGDECPEGQQQVMLAWESDDRLCDLCDPFADAPPASPPSSNAAVDALAERIKRLENSAYFEVVNRKDETIFRVGPGEVRVFNGDGKAVAVIGTADRGGYFTARSTSGPFDISIGVSGARAGARALDTGLSRIELGTRDGPYGLRFPSASGLIAGIGASRAGSGAIVAGTVAGQVKGSFSVPDGRGMVSVVREPGIGGVAMAEATIGGGLLEVADWNNQAAVKMGHNDHRYGVVLAGPVPGLPYVPRSGQPGSYFMGCASGERPACVPEVHK